MVIVLAGNKNYSLSSGNRSPKINHRHHYHQPVYSVYELTSYHTVSLSIFTQFQRLILLLILGNIAIQNV